MSTQQTSALDNVAPGERRQDPRVGGTPAKLLATIGAMVAFVLWAHFGSGMTVFRSQSTAEPGWEKFRTEYRINHFGDDGQFVRAVQNGYNLVHYTYKYAPRFTRKSAGDAVNTCASCHTVDDIAYGFVNSDRVDPKLGKRFSFEDRVRWCYANSLDGAVPTIYDPAVRDIRLLARAVAHHLQLNEGALKKSQR
jgi:cytochrome c